MVNIRDRRSCRFNTIMLPVVLTALVLGRFSLSENHTYHFAMTCSTDHGPVSCDAVHRSRRAFSFSDPGGGPTNSSGTDGSDTANNCPIEEFCTCTGTISGEISVTCTGFVDSNTTAVQDILVATSAECAIEVNRQRLITYDNGTVLNTTVTYCLKDPEISHPNRGVSIAVPIIAAAVCVTVIVGIFAWRRYGQTVSV
jgi:hypothetical protein